MDAAIGVIRAALALLAVSLALAPAAAFAGSAFNTLYHEYQSTGAIQACKHSTAELQAALGEVPPDISQYAPDFPAALQAALQARAHGVCGGVAAATGAPVGAASGTPGAGGSPGSAPAASGTAPGSTPAPVAAPASASAISAAAASLGGGGASSAPAPLIALAAVLVLLALAALWWTAATLRGTQPRRLGVTAHALGEVRVRAASTVREFADWLRLGR